MTLVRGEDITVAWGCPPHPIEAQNGHWRTSVFQDVQESSDGSCLYFLYDPIADERNRTGAYHSTGNAVLAFDLSLKCFTQVIPLYTPGNPKFLFALRPQSVGGETRAVVVSQIETGGGAVQLHFTLINLATNQHIQITTPLDIACDFICTIREDAPELIVMSNPGLQVWRLAIDVMRPTEPIEYFRVIGAQLNHFYDGFICGGTVVFVSAHTDGNLDYTRVHLLDMNSHSLTTRGCMPDVRGEYPCPRLQAAIVALHNSIIVCGGEVVHSGRYGQMAVQRLSDYWRLDLNTFQWEQCQGQMPVPFIEPRVTSTYPGRIYLWGDWDGSLPGIPSGTTHLRIVRVDGFNTHSLSQPMDMTNQQHPQQAPYPSAPHHSSYGNLSKGKALSSSDGTSVKSMKSKCCCTLM